MPGNLRMRTAILTTPESPFGKALRAFMFACGLLVAGVIVWEAVMTSGVPNPLAPGASISAAVLDIGVLVFREGLECVLVLAAITAGTNRYRSSGQKPVMIGVGAGLVATLATWVAAVRVLDDLSQRISALALQAATGLLAVLVLLVVMNWFFHRLYWTGWISLHSKRKRELLEQAGAELRSPAGVFWGMALLGFTSLYREGFEVVLFLQSYRLRLGGTVVLGGACLGIALTAIVAFFTFVAHQKLPYRRMLILTGILLGIVLVVMVGEQAQEMQLAHWIPATPIPALVPVIPTWMGLWLSIFPTVETLLAQAIAAALVLGSYAAAKLPMNPKATRPVFPKSQPPMTPPINPSSKSPIRPKPLPRVILPQSQPAISPTRIQPQKLCGIVSSAPSRRT
jgi:high-affinity iron transporter